MNKQPLTHDERRWRATRDIVTDVSHWINDRHSLENFVQLMRIEDRATQQSFTALCLTWLNHLASLGPAGYDLRNEASVLIAKEIITRCPDVKYLLPFSPERSIEDGCTRKEV